MSIEKNGKLYRYYYGETNKYDHAQKKLKEAIKRGFSKAFVVAFDGEKKISVSEALEKLK